MSLGLAAAIPRRRTDRRPFGSWPVPDAFLQELLSCAAGQGALLRVVDEPSARGGLMAAIRDAAAAQDDMPGYRTELSLWSSRTATDDGIPAANLLRDASGGVKAGHRLADGEIELADGDEDSATLTALGMVPVAQSAWATPCS